MDGGTVKGEKTAKTPPYISFSTLKTFISDLHDHDIPSRIDRSILTRFSGTAQNQLMTALRFLELIDHGGKPTAELGLLAKSYGTADWSPNLATVIKKSYAPIFAIDLASSTPSQFNETFGQAFPGTEAVMRKCISFFLPAAKEAAIPISDRILKGKKPRSGNGPRPKAQRRQPATGTTPPPPPTPTPPPPAGSSSSLTQAPIPPTSYQLLAMFDPGEMSAEEQAAVWLLIQYAKKKEAVQK